MKPDQENPTSKDLIEAGSDGLSSASDMATRGLALLHDAKLTRTESTNGGWWGRLRAKLFGTVVSPPMETRFKLAFIRAIEERYPSSASLADDLISVFDLERITGAVTAEESGVKVFCERKITEMLTGDGETAVIFLLTTTLLRAQLDLAAKATTIRVVIDGTLLDENGLEQRVCVLSVEAARIVLESFDWKVLNDSQILEGLGFRYAEGKRVVAHGA